MSPRSTSALTLEHVLLALLDSKPMHGYELYQDVCRLPGISLIWNIKQPLLYAMLDKLERQDFLESQQVQGETYPPRKYFRLTPFGQASLASWRKTPVRRARDLRQEFLARLIVARRYGQADALDLIHAQQLTCQAWYDELTANRPVYDATHLDEWLVYSFRINRVEGVLSWLKTCESEINQIVDNAAAADSSAITK
jgi:PadR family transcriptional regulator PadR